MQRISLKREPKLDAKHEAFAFQAEGIKAIRGFDYAAIFHEQGLGKSKMAIDLMLYWLENKLIDTALFVVKKGLLYNWEKEFSSHMYFKPRLLTQNRKENFYTFNSPSRLILTHYEVLKGEKARFKLFLKSRNVGVILDESAKIKNPDSALTQAIFELAPLFRKRVVMTGTPVANRPYDIWAQIWFLDQGESLGRDFNEFKVNADLTNQLCENEDTQHNFEVYLDDIYSRISSFTIRETKQSGIIELPEKEIRTLRTDWEYHQHDLYQRIQKEMRAVVVRDGVPSEDKADDILKRLLRFVQIASNPRLVDQSYAATPGKLEPLLALVSEIWAKGEKCIIWSSFTGTVDWLSSELQQYGTTKIHGKLNMEKRNRAVDRFLTNDDTHVLIATPGAAKEGLTLTVANHVIYYDRGFSLDDYLQSQDRIHRISQTKKCFVYRLIMTDSIDEWIDVLLEAKHLAAQLTQGDISLDYYKSQVSYEFGGMVKGILGLDDPTGTGR